jgi:hypothetical protein
VLPTGAEACSFPQDSRKIDRVYNSDATEGSQTAEMPVTGDDQVGAPVNRALKNPVVVIVIFDFGQCGSRCDQLSDFDKQL